MLKVSPVSHIQLWKRKISQLALKMAEGDSTLKEILFCFRGLKTDAVLYKIVYPPVFSFCIPGKTAAIQSGNQMQTASWVRVLQRQKLRDSFDIAHQARDISEGTAAQALENVALPLIGNDQESQVDVSLSVWVTGDGTP